MWFGIDEDYRIHVSKNLLEETPHNRAMKALAREKILLPNHKLYYPRIDALQWHLDNTAMHI